MRRTAHPALTFAVGAALTLVSSYPTIVRARRGAIDLSDGAARIVALLALSWCLVHLVATLVARLTSGTASSPPPGPGVVERLPGREAAERPRAA